MVGASDLKLDTTESRCERRPNEMARSFFGVRELGMAASMTVGSEGAAADFFGNNSRLSGSSKDDGNVEDELWRADDAEVSQWPLEPE